MPLMNDKDHSLLIETGQTMDTFHITSVHDTLHVRLLSVRSQEAQIQELANQDYAQVRIQPDGYSLCFCVCDGVGSSYKGDFAAQYLAKHLVQWMQTLNDLQVQASSIAIQLDAQLNLWARAAQEELLQVALPHGTPALVREVLEELRDTYGSETVFLCGRIDLNTRSTLSNAEDTNGARPAQLLVCWMGNVTARLLAEACSERDEDKSHRSEVSLTMLGGDDDRVARWSTLRGARGPITVWHRHLTRIEHLIIHTDGLNAIAQSLYNLDDQTWQSKTQQLLLLPSSDDMTALELRWQEQLGV
jgi:Protein phosphatase 2C